MTEAANKNDLDNVINNCSDVGATDFSSCYCKRNIFLFNYSQNSGKTRSVMCKKRFIKTQLFSAIPWLLGDIYFGCITQNVLIDHQTNLVLVFNLSPISQCTSILNKLKQTQPVK